MLQEQNKKNKKKKKKKEEEETIAGEIISTCIIYVQYAAQKRKIAFMFGTPTATAATATATSMEAIWSNIHPGALVDFGNRKNRLFTAALFCARFSVARLNRHKCQMPMVLGLLTICAFAFIMFECVKQSTHTYTESNGNLLETSAHNHVWMNIHPNKHNESTIFYSLFHFGHGD